MSQKSSSLAVEEVVEQNHRDGIDVVFEPELKVLINKRYLEDSESVTEVKPVSIRGRITVSF